MLTLKVIRENPEFVIERLAVKNFDAKKLVAEIAVLDDDRKALQNKLDNCLALQKQKANAIGAAMKAGNKAEAEALKVEVAALKAESVLLQEES